MIKRGNEIKQGEKNIVFSGNQGDLVIQRENQLY